MVFFYLTPLELTVCARVSKSLHILTTPYVWHDLRITNFKNLDRFLKKPAQQALIKNAQQIRELDLPTVDDYRAFLPRRKPPPSSLTQPWEPTSLTEYHPALCTNIQKMWLPRQRLFIVVNADDVITPELGDAFVALLQQNQSLTSFFILTDMSQIQLLRLTTQGPLNLRELKVHMSIGAVTAKVLLEDLPESIENVTLGLVSDDRDGKETHMRTNELARQPRRSHPALETLVIDWASGTPYEEYVLLAFLHTCSTKLKHFGRKLPRYLRTESVRAALEQLKCAPRSLDFYFLPLSMSLTDEDIAATLRLGNRWEEISLQDCRQAGPLTVATLLDRCEHVRDLNVVSRDCFSSKDLCAVLGKAAKLQRLIAIESQEENWNPVILGEDLIMTDWASLSLVEWTCMIKVPRYYNGNNGPEDEDRDINNEVVRSRNIQRQIYRKLALQTGLRELQLGLHVDFFGGTGPDETWRQEQCLEMNLTSGLDELACLKELEILNVDYMKHQIGIPELEWMAKNWPRLTRIKGLFKTCLAPMPGAQQWVYDNKPSWITQSDLYYS